MPIFCRATNRLLTVLLATPLAILVSNAVGQALLASDASMTLSPSGNAVTGSGSFAIHPTHDDSAPAVSVACTAEAAPPHRAVSVAIESCRLYKGSTLVLAAPASARQGHAWATQRTATIGSQPEGAFTVCWTVRGDFDNTESLTNQDCGTEQVQPPANDVTVTTHAHETRSGVITVTCVARASAGAVETRLDRCGPARGATATGPIVTNGYVQTGDMPLGEGLTGSKVITVCFEAEASFVTAGVASAADCRTHVPVSAGAV